MPQKHTDSLTAVARCRFLPLSVGPDRKRKWALSSRRTSQPATTTRRWPLSRRVGAMDRVGEGLFKGLVGRCAAHSPEKVLSGAAQRVSLWKAVHAPLATALSFSPEDRFWYSNWGAGRLPPPPSWTSLLACACVARRRSRGR